MAPWVSIVVVFVGLLVVSLLNTVEVSSIAPDDPEGDEGDDYSSYEYSYENMDDLEVRMDLAKTDPAFLQSIQEASKFVILARDTMQKRNPLYSYVEDYVEYLRNTSSLLQNITLLELEQTRRVFLSMLDSLEDMLRIGKRSVKGSEKGNEVNNVYEEFEKRKENIANQYKEAVERAEKLYEEIQNEAKEAEKKIRDDVKSAVLHSLSIADSMERQAEGMLEELEKNRSSLSPEAAKRKEEYWRQVLEKATSLRQESVNALYMAGQGARDRIQESLEEAQAKKQNDARGLRQALTNGVTRARKTLDDVTDGVNNIAKSVMTSTGELVKGVGGLAANATHGVINLVSGTMTNIKDFFKGGYKDLVG